MKLKTLFVLTLVAGTVVPGANASADALRITGVVAPVGQYFIEFHGRGIGTEGHAFFVLSVAREDGVSEIQSAAGFYPDSDSPIGFKDVFNGPGEVYREIPTLNEPGSERFRVLMTPDQERLARFIINNWDSKNYAALWQNCVTMVTDIARAMQTGSVTALTPRSFVICESAIHKRPFEMRRPLAPAGARGSALWPPAPRCSQSLSSARRSARTAQSRSRTPVSGAAPRSSPRASASGAWLDRLAAVRRPLALPA